jgi:hypothetical protein
LREICPSNGELLRKRGVSISATEMVADIAQI